MDALDTVVALEGLPRSDIGAPSPLVLADEFSTAVAYRPHIRAAERRGFRRTPSCGARSSSVRSLSQSPNAACMRPPTIYEPRSRSSWATRGKRRPPRLSKQLILLVFSSKLSGRRDLNPEEQAPSNLARSLIFSSKGLNSASFPPTGAFAIRRHP